MKNKETLAKAIAYIAWYNDLKPRDGAYVSPDGERFVATKYGLIRAVQENAQVKAKKLEQKVSELSMEKKSLMKTLNYYYLFERVLDDKAFIKIVRIIESRVPDSEKILQIKKYLNL
ncbi:MAG: hypothetical protein PWQ06_1655 [Anaerophaga sp.]|nr:hypothetical protein [Anaerophaga sp.]